jgi:hypothetical protein
MSDVIQVNVADVEMPDMDKIIADSEPTPEPTPPVEEPPVVEEPPPAPKPKKKKVKLPKAVAQLNILLNKLDQCATITDKSKVMVAILNHLMSNPTTKVLDAVLAAMREGRCVPPSTFQLFLAGMNKTSSNRFSYLMTALSELNTCMTSNRRFSLSIGAIQVMVKNDAIVQLISTKVNKFK